MDKTLVVAKYQEDVSWLSQLQAGFNIIVYDKFDPNADHPLPNVGREAHTYIHHIIQNYDNLSTINIFIQAYPFQHSANFIDKLHRLTDKTRFADLSDIVIEDFHGKELEKFFFKLFPGYEFPKNSCVKANAMFAVHKSRIYYHDLNFYKEIYKSFGDCPIPKYCFDEGGLQPFIMERLWSFIFAGPMLELMLVKSHS